MREIYDEKLGKYVLVASDHVSVPALPERRVVDPAAIQRITQPLVEQTYTNGAIDGGALRAMESGEKSTPIQRGLGATIILGALMIGGLLIAWVLMEAGAGQDLAALAFLGCAGVGGWLTYQQVTRYSPTGVELDKTDKYENIRLEEIASGERVAMRKIDVLERALEASYDRTDRAK